MRVPPLAVGLGIYLPTAATLMIVVGAVAGWFFDRRADRTSKPEATKQLGVLLASGSDRRRRNNAVVIAAIKSLFEANTRRSRWSGRALKPLGISSAALRFAAIAIGLYRWVLHLAPARAQ